MQRELTSEDACISVRVPAKLNLFLAVRGRRADGYHELVTVMQSVSVFDRVRVALLGPPGQRHHPAGRRRMRVELWLNGEDELPPGSENLAVRAAKALGSAAGVFDNGSEEAAAGAAVDEAAPRTVIELRKEIPIAGGMAGGSADAAGALVALNELWGCELSRERLREVGAQVGSDVPFCVVGGTALATGRGTRLAQVLARGAYHWVVCQDAQPMETKQVYRSWDRVCSPSEIEPDAVLHALRGQDAEALGAALHNDLEPAAFALRPDLEERKHDLLDAGALGVVLSGSGPTLLALADDERAARALSGQVEGLFARITVARSPVGGPELRHE